MGKRVEKALKGGAPTSASSRAGDDCSTPEPYNCTGNFADDFAELWQRAGLDKDYIPVVRPRGKRPGTPTVDEAKTTAEEEHSEPVDEEPPPTSYTIVDNLFIKKPSIQVEFDVEETKQMQINHAKEIFIRSWKLEEKVVNVLKQCGLDRLQCINMWNVGLTEHALKSLANFLPSLSSLRTLVLDGNPLPETEPYHHLISEDSPLQHLSLRNNKITDLGAKLISQCLGQVGASQNRCLTTLNLSYNHIGDDGATSLASGLRMNRTLLSLSLASNQIGDAGCEAIADILQRLALTHEEVVKRRKLMSKQGYYGRGYSAPGSRRGDSKDRPGSNRSGSQMAARASRGSSKKKDGKKEAADKTPKKEERGKKGELNKVASKMSVTNEAPKGKGKKSGGGKDGGKRPPATSNTADSDGTDTPEFINPLLDPNTEHTEGKVFVPGCTTLVHLNLSRNKIGAIGMKAMLNAVQYHITRHRMVMDSPAAPGLLKVFLQKNQVPEEHPVYVAIQDSMLPRDPMYKPEVKSPEDDAQSVAG